MYIAQETVVSRYGWGRISLLTCVRTGRRGAAVVSAHSM